jgi:hypothetical protein
MVNVNILRLIMTASPLCLGSIGVATGAPFWIRHVGGVGWARRIAGMNGSGEGREGAAITPPSERQFGMTTLSITWMTPFAW